MYCLSGCAIWPCTWFEEQGKLTLYIKGSPPKVTSSSAEECRDQCMNQSTFICAAVNYKLSDGICELLAETHYTAYVDEPRDENWQSFFRPSCAGNVINVFF